MNMMRNLMPRMITVLMSILVMSHASINLSGNEGMALFKELTNVSLNVDVSNNNTFNLSNRTLVQLSGDSGTSVFVNLTNDPSYRFGTNITDDLSNWGSKPRVPPPPSPNPDRQLIEVLRLNHGIV
jgi:hypothetical protein